MTNLLEHYQILGVNVGAGINDVTSSYRRLCRVYHPDVNDDPESEELMKRINIAYSVLREKLLRDAAFRERQTYSRPVRRYYNPEAEKEAYSVINDYFRLISECDYSGAYNYISSYDMRYITRESFIEWRKSVARLYPMREFTITGGLPAAAVSFEDGRIRQARRYHVAVTEENYTEEPTQQGAMEKLVISENGMWRVFLGYRGVGDLTRSFDERFETKRKRDITKRWEEYYTGRCLEYDMLSLTGMRKALSRELYRQRRFGGTLTFAAFSVDTDDDFGNGHEELLRSAAKTITAALRETDVPAYAGDGVFAILFVELRKKNVEEIFDRLVEKILKNAGPRLGGRAKVDYEYESWTGHSPADMDGLNKVLKKFRKKV